MSDAAENPTPMLEEAAPSRAVDCWGGLGLSLAKHLAGSPIDISETEFIAWAKAGSPPDEERRFALHEALLNMHADETRRALFDGRATTRQVAEAGHPLRRRPQPGVECPHSPSPPGT